MVKCYFEFRQASLKGGSLTIDIMRHLHTRQHLGKSVVVCEQPRITLSAARKQWLKLSRNVQKKRASTLDADKILKYTHAVTHMQHMRFTTKSPFDEPEASVYFLNQETLETLPAQCFTLYLTCQPTDDQISTIVAQLAPSALVVDYDQTTNWARRGLGPKSELETRIHSEWQRVQQFLATYHIDIKTLAGSPAESVEFMEEALDILLGASRSFLEIANSFQHALELARPVRLDKSIRVHYDTAILLAHRVQALLPGAFSGHFLETYNEDDTFFLYDRVRDIALQRGENVREAIARHVKAGRLHLAEALRQYYLADANQQSSIAINNRRRKAPVGLER